MMNYRLFFFALLLTYLPCVSLAEVSWVEKVRTCEEFSQGVIGFYKHLGDLSAVNGTQEAELAVVLEAACGPRFTHCKFDICQMEHGATAKPEATPEATPVPTPTPTPEPEVITSSDVDQYGIQRNPLAWLGHDLSCGDFKDQIRSRYGPLGPWDQLPPKTTRELQTVLETACSSRFKHCGFRRCAKASNVLPDEVVLDIDPNEHASAGLRRYIELLNQRAQAMRDHRTQYEILTRSIARAIDSQSGHEREQGLYWQQFSVPEEIQRLNAQRQKRKTRKIIKAGP